MTPLTKLRDDFKDRVDAFHKISNDVSEYSSNAHDQDLKTFCYGYDAATRFERERAKGLLNALERISQLETMQLNDSNTLLKKHNLMATFARESIEAYKARV